MAETIESFVNKLQTEGVEAGKQAAEKLLAEAKQQADKIVQDAEAQAEKNLADAKAEGESLLARSQTELELAARDVIARLKDSLSRVLEAVLFAKTKGKLSESDFLSTTLHDLIMLYAKADIERKHSMKIGVSKEMRSKLAKWAMSEMTKKAEAAGISIDLKASLSGAGFEYSVNGATVEVTPESVVETISELVSPHLREVIDKAIGNPPSSLDQPEPQAANEVK
jgi:V/A-type H+-transporting ATPase subunit E